MGEVGGGGEGRTDEDADYEDGDVSTGHASVSGGWGHYCGVWWDGGRVWGRRSAGDGFNCLCQLGNVFIFVWIFNVCRMRLLVWRVVTYSTFNPSSVERCQSGGATAIDPSF